jgi:hypothetical protein
VPFLVCFLIFLLFIIPPLPEEGRGYTVNVYKNQLSQQTGSRNLTGLKTLPTIWYTYMTLVTKYQISAIISYWGKCDGRKDRRTDEQLLMAEIWYLVTSFI